MHYFFYKKLHIVFLDSSIEGKTLANQHSTDGVQSETEGMGIVNLLNDIEIFSLISKNIC